ncbi:hypothetical protein HaLaN_04160, partial [Haematococcus lacustris]
TLGFAPAGLVTLSRSASCNLLLNSTGSKTFTLTSFNFDPSYHSVSICNAIDCPAPTSLFAEQPQATVTTPALQLSVANIAPGNISV